MRLMTRPPLPRVRCVFSERGRQVRLGNGGPPGPLGSLPPGEKARQATRWRAVTRVLRSCIGGFEAAAADILQAALPSDCRVCGAPMLGLLPVRVCDACLECVRAQAAAPGALCSRCGDALGMESARFAAAMGVGECTQCRVNPPDFARAVAFGSYDHEMREMLHALKFDGMRRVAEHALGRWMAEAVLQLQAEAAGELVVVPVPLFHERQRQRGFNQAELLAHSAVKRLAKLQPAWKLDLRPAALTRVRDTRALFALRPDQRRRSLAGAFKIGDAEAVRGREVLLVDDILTTGATVNACARVLLRAGAERVWVATVARAQPENTRALESSVTRWDAVPPRTKETPGFLRE